MDATTKADTKPHTGRALDRDLFCPRLEHLLMGAAAELGQRGNLAQVVASIERGGVGGAGEDPNLGMLRRLGATDTRGIDGRIGRLRELERRWALLDRKHQRTALAHYLGTPRAHDTVRSHFGQGQGGLAGVVLLRWETKQAKARERGAITGMGPLAAELEGIRAELRPLEREAATLTAELDRPLPDLGEAPERPYVPLVLRGATVKRELAPYHAAIRAWREPLRAAQERRHEVSSRLSALRPLLPPLQAQQARLCGALADAAVLATSADDEQGLVQLCRSGKLDPGAHLTGAETDVRALHRAWYATAKRAAREWVEGETAA